MHKLSLYTIVISIFFSSLAMAGDAQMRDAKKCIRYFSHYERKHNIPYDLLKAVSLTESGVWHKQSSQVIPWPWAVNFQGKGYHYNSKKEAIDAVRLLQKQGHSSIDVGCMQINLHYHPNAFRDLEEAFEPRDNIAYGASFLKENYQRHSNWRSAVASYHSETNEFGKPYAKKVIETWKNFGNKPLESFNIRNKSRTEVASVNKKRLRSSYFNNAAAKSRRKSDIFIKVHKPAVVNTNSYDMVENIANSALANFNKGKNIPTATTVE